MLVGCASNPDKLEATSVSTVQFEGHSCEQVAADAARIDGRMTELHADLTKKREGDVAKTAVAVVLFWPAALFLKGNNTPEANEFRRLKGEYDALEQVSNAKGCGVAFKEIATS